MLLLRRFCLEYFYEILFMSIWSFFLCELDVTLIRRFSFVCKVSTTFTKLCRRSHGVTKFQCSNLWWNMLLYKLLSFRIMDSRLYFLLELNPKRMLSKLLDRLLWHWLWLLWNLLDKLKISHQAITTFLQKTSFYLFQIFYNQS